MLLETGLTVQLIPSCSQQTAVAAISDILYISNIPWQVVVYAYYITTEHCYYITTVVLVQVP